MTPSEKTEKTPLCSRMGILENMHPEPLPGTLCPATCWSAHACGIQVTRLLPGRALLFLHPLIAVTKLLLWQLRQPLHSEGLFPCPKFHTHDTEAQLEMKNMVHYLGSVEKNVMALFSSCFYAFKNMLISFFM